MSPVRSVTYVSGPDRRLYGGGGGIRTPETLSGLTVFKTAGFNRSPTPPILILLHLWTTLEKSVAHLRPYPHAERTNLSASRSLALSVQSKRQAGLCQAN